MGTESRIEKENPLPVLNPAQHPPNLSKPDSQRETDTVDVSKVHAGIYYNGVLIVCLGLDAYRVWSEQKAAADPLSQDSYLRRMVLTVRTTFWKGGLGQLKFAPTLHRQV